MVIAFDDAKVSRIDTNTGEPIWSIDAEAAVNQITFAPDGRHLAIAQAGAQDQVQWLDAETGGGVWRYGAQDDVVNDIALVPDGERMAIAWDDAKVDLIDTNTGEIIWNFNAEAAVSRLAFAPDGRHLAIAQAGAQDQVQWLDAETGGGVWRYGAQDDVVNDIALVPDGERMAIGLGRRKGRPYRYQHR